MKITAIKFMLSGILMSTAAFSFAANDQDCKKLQDEKNLILAAYGYCFKDKDAQKEYGTECQTKRPSFGAAEGKRFAEIEAKQKELKCPKKD